METVIPALQWLGIQPEAQLLEAGLGTSFHSNTWKISHLKVQACVGFGASGTALA